MKTIKQLTEENKSILLPVAYDAVTARIIEKVGFPAMSIGGFGVVASRFGYPDFGIASYKEMKDAVSEISQSVDLPCLVDADDGYGDFLNIERTIQDYEKIEQISCIFIEDQAHPKRCGHLKGKKLVSEEEMVKKIKVAVSARRRGDLMIMARTDARLVEDLDAALHRGEAYLNAGADALFIESPTSEVELEKIGKTFKDIPLMANMLNGGDTPLLSRETLEDMGYSIIAYPTLALYAAVKAVEDSMRHLKEHGTVESITDTLATKAEVHDLIGITKAFEKEKAYLSL